MARLIHPQIICIAQILFSEWKNEKLRSLNPERTGIETQVCYKSAVRPQLDYFISSTLSFSIYKIDIITPNLFCYRKD